MASRFLQYCSRGHGIRELICPVKYFHKRTCNWTHSKYIIYIWQCIHEGGKCRTAKQPSIAVAFNLQYCCLLLCLFLYSLKMAILFHQISTAWLCHCVRTVFCYSLTLSLWWNNLLLKRYPITLRYYSGASGQVNHATLNNLFVATCHFQKYNKLYCTH